MSTTAMSGSNGQEERESLLSAMYDGQVTAGEGDLVARRLARDPALRRRWSGYALAGAVLRGEQQTLAGARFAARVASAIAAEPAHGLDESADARAGALASRSGFVPGVHRTGRPSWARWWRPVAGVGVAAGVAAASILILRLEPVAVPLAATPPPAAPPAAPRAATPALAVFENPFMYSTPRGTPAPHPFLPDRVLNVPAAQLANYVVAHSEYSNPLGRRNLLSALMAGESFGATGATGAAGGPGRGPDPADGSALDEPAGAGDAGR